MTTTSTRKSTTARLCADGCGTPLVRKTSRYAPGHDARHAGEVARIVAETGNRKALDLLASPALKAKAAKMVDRLASKSAARSAKATATASVPDVKVGRWTYPARRNGKVIERNTKRDGSGEWIAA